MNSRDPDNLPQIHNGRRKRLYWKIREKTARFRRLPDFIIVGAAKSGSTSLYDYLCDHPRIAAAFRKEVHYFDQNSDKGDLWYRAHFPLKIGRSDTLTGEATPYYCFHPGVAPQTAKLLPHVKIIFILREPISRAFSHHQQNLRRNIDDLDFAEAIASEETRISDLHRRLKDRTVAYARDHQHFSYAARGRYMDQIDDWLQYYPEERLLIIFTEELQSDPDNVLRQVTDFLGIGDFPRKAAPRISNSGCYRYNISDQMIDSLQRYYAASNKRLAQFVGRDLPWKGIGRTGASPKKEER